MVAADSEEEAEMALEHIDVNYEPLPVITNPQEALKPVAIKIHEKGNVAHRVEYAKGRAQDAFQNVGPDDFRTVSYSAAETHVYRNGSRLQRPN